MNNPVQFVQMMRNPQMHQQIMQAMRGFNPTKVLDQIENNPEMMENPMVNNIMQMRKNNDSEGLTGMAENVFSEKGHDYSDFEKQMKQFLGSN